MAFSPLFGKIITEECLSDTGFTTSGDVTIDGSIRLTPTIKWIEVDEHGSPNLDWAAELTFDGSGDILSNGFDTGDVTYLATYNYDGWYTGEILWPKDYVSIIGREQKPDSYPSGEVHGVSFDGAAWQAVDNEDGYTFEVTFYQPIYPDYRTYGVHSVIPDSFLPAAQGGPFYIDFDDGTKKGRIWVDPFSTFFMPDGFDKFWREIQTGIGGNAHSLYPLKYWITYTLYPRTLRVTVKGDEVWITTNAGVSGTTSEDGNSNSYEEDPDDGPVDVLAKNVSANVIQQLLDMIGNQIGYSSWMNSEGSGNQITTLGNLPQYYIPPSWREPQDPPTQKYHLHLENAGLGDSSGTKKFSINHSRLGERINGQGCTAGIFMLDEFKVDTSGFHEGYTSITYSGEGITTTPACQPIYPVGSWDQASFKLVVPENSGTTKIQVQYLDGTWQDHGSEYTVTGETGTIDLSGISVDGDIEDAIRFKITQTPSPPSGEPPRVDEIYVAATPASGDFDMSPHFGPASGGTWVTLSWSNPPGSFAGGQDVWVGDLQLASASIQHVDANTKRIQMPARAAGSYPIKVVGSTYWGVRPYVYVDSYEVEEDVGGVVNTGDLEIVFGNMRSPFRVLSHPPNHAVNLALVGTTPMSPDVHMSLLDLSDREPSNLTGFGLTDDHLYNGISGEFTFEQAVNTEDVLISNRSAMRREVEAPSPLYYKYLIGRDRYYVYVPAASDATDIETIRSALTVFEDGGAVPSFAWDIIVSNLDYEGNALPSKVYSVVLLVSNISINTMWVSYRGIDRLSGYENSAVRREIINPVLLFDDKTGRMNFTVTPVSDGSYNVEVEV